MSVKVNALSVHPLYAAKAWEWTFSWISMLGGRAYLYPPIPYSPLDTDRQLVRGVDTDNDSAATLSMLERHPREDNVDYRARLRRAVYVNKIARIVRARVAHVLDDPTIDRVTPPALADYLRDCDAAGNGRTAWMRRGQLFSQVFGHAFALTEIPSLPGGIEPASAAEAAEAGQEVYSTWFTPLDVLDWQMDARGAFEWIVLRYEEYFRARPSLGRTRDAKGRYTTEPAPTVRYRVWFRDHWEDWTQETTGEVIAAEPKLVGQGVNPIGRVPIDVLYNLPNLIGVDPVGTSSILDACYGNRTHFNLTSWKDDQLASQTFAQLAVPGAKGDALKKLQLGVHRYIGYSVGAGGGKPEYFAPPVEPTTLLISEIGRIEQQLDMLAGMSRGLPEQSIAARPVEALAFESADKAAELRAVIAEAQAFEARQLRTVAAWVGASPDGITVEYGEPNMGDRKSAQVPRNAPTEAPMEEGVEADAEPTMMNGSARAARRVRRIARRRRA